MSQSGNADGPSAFVDLPAFIQRETPRLELSPACHVFIGARKTSARQMPKFRLHFVAPACSQPSSSLCFQPHAKLPVSVGKMPSTRMGIGSVKRHHNSSHRRKRMNIKLKAAWVGMSLALTASLITPAMADEWD